MSDDLVRWQGFEDVHAHTTALLASPSRCTIGVDTKIWAFAHISRGADIGSNCMIGEGVHVGPGVKIGNGCRIQNGAQLFEGVTLEENVFIGPHVVFTNVKTPRAFVKRVYAFELTLVKKGASIGANATILPGIVIGEYALVGAGAVVTKDVRKNMRVVGNPAGQVADVCDCGERLRLCTRPGNAPYAICYRCHARYTFDEAGPLREVDE